MNAESCVALVLVASWNTSVPWLEMTVNGAINPRNRVASLYERGTVDEPLDTFV